MNTTRNTIRADGQSVGEAMDKQAEFLRSIGIPATVGPLTRDEQREEFTYKVRDTVLKALDSLAPNGKGWTDQDLPQLFKALDKHAEALFERLQR